MGSSIELSRKSSQRRTCDLSDENIHYEWELIDSQVLQTALNFRRDVESLSVNKNALKHQIYAIKS